MIYVTGDLHGDPARLSDRALRRLKKGDFLLVCGDFGFVWDGSPAEMKLRRKLGKKKYTTIFVDGAHDNLPMIRQFPEEDYAGGTVRRIEGNLLYAERGTILVLAGQTVFFLGGGVSEDLDERMESGTWHREEMPTAEELAEAGARLYQNGGADIIITHQPSDRMRIFLGGDRSEESPLGAFLDQVEQEGRFGSWYFGRLHRDKRIPPRHTVVFREIVPVQPV